MTAIAVQKLARADSVSIGFIGCGVQARSHFDVLRLVLPDLKEVVACSRSAASAERFVAMVRGAGLVAHDTRTPRGHRRPGRNHHHCARGRAGPRVSRYRLGHARCVRRCGRPSALVETRHAARDGHPCHRRTRADACPDGLGAHDVRRPYEADFADLASGAFKGRSSAMQRAMFNFSGHALADLAVGQVVYETALRKGLGTRLAR